MNEVFTFVARLNSPLKLRLFWQRRNELNQLCFIKTLSFIPKIIFKSVDFFLFKTVVSIIRQQLVSTSNHKLLQRRDTNVKKINQLESEKK